MNEQNDTRPWYLCLLQLAFGVALIVGSVYGWKIWDINPVLMILTGLGGLAACWHALNLPNVE